VKNKSTFRLRIESALRTSGFRDIADGDYHVVIKRYKTSTSYQIDNVNFTDENIAVLLEAVSKHYPRRKVTIRNKKMTHLVPVSIPGVVIKVYGITKEDE